VTGTGTGTGTSGGSTDVYGSRHIEGGRGIAGLPPRPIVGAGCSSAGSRSNGAVDLGCGVYHGTSSASGNAASPRDGGPRGSPCHFCGVYHGTSSASGSAASPRDGGPRGSPCHCNGFGCAFGGAFGFAVGFTSHVSSNPMLAERRIVSWIVNGVNAKTICWYRWSLISLLRRAAATLALS
jgi:hypothetical protein